MINHRDILQLCRLCLVEEKVNHPIFEEAGDLRSIFLKITSCLPVSIRKDDSLPKKICDSCISKLDSLYEFWNETANAEKQMLQWLNESALNSVSKITPTEAIKNKMENTQVKEEIDIGDTKAEAIEMSSEAQTYILQQQQLPYSSIPPKIIPTPDDTEEPAPKRPRRASAMKALEQMETDEEDDDFGAENFAKSETEDSDKEGGEETYAEPSTSMDDQPGPSGMGKGTTEAPDEPKPCQIKLVDVRSLVNSSGKYVLPGRRRKFTCYQCFERFDTASLLDDHKASHNNQDSEDENTGPNDGGDSTDKEVPSESESSDSDSDPPLAAVIPKRRVKTPEKTPVNKKVIVPLLPIPSNVPAVTPKKIEDPNMSERIKKLPTLNNINIKCGTCESVFTNSDQLKEHVPVDPARICHFVCKVCTDTYSSPLNYLEHLIQHNNFISNKSGFRNMSERKYFCLACDIHFQHYHQLAKHKDTHHSGKPPVEVKIEPNQDKNRIQEKKIIPQNVVESKKPRADVIELSEEEDDPPEVTQRNKKIKSLMVANSNPPESLGTPIIHEYVDSSTMPHLEEETSIAAVEEEVTCDLCYDKFSSSQAYEEHMKFHNTNANNTTVLDLKYTCEVCGKYFLTMHGLRKHRRLKEH